MKRILLLLFCSCFFVIPEMQAKDVKDFLKVVVNEKNCEKVEIGGLVLSVVGTFNNMMGVRSIKCYDISNPSDKFKKEIDQIIKMRQPFDDLEMLVSENEEGSSNRIWVDIDDKIVKQIFIINVADDACSIVYLKGHIDTDKIKEITDKYDKDK